MKLIPYPHANQLCESMQVNEVKFAFTNKLDSGDYQLITNFVKCREYFNEFLMKNHHPDEFNFKEVYGFTYKHAEFPYQMQKPSIAIKLPRKDMYPIFIENLEFLNQIEDFNGIEKTYIVETSNNQSRGTQFVLEFSPLWINNCMLFNIYTLLIKLCTLNVKVKSLKEMLEPYSIYTKPSELVYLESIKLRTFNNILNNIKDLFTLNSKYVDGFDTIRDAYAVHAASGLLSFIKYTNDVIKDTKLYKLLDTVCNKQATTIFIKEA